MVICSKCHGSGVTGGMSAGRRRRHVVRRGGMDAGDLDGGRRRRVRRGGDLIGGRGHLVRAKVSVGHSPWIKHVLATARKHGISYKEAMSLGSETYHRR